MNIFKEYQGFTGTIKFSKGGYYTFSNILELSKNIKNQLGKKSYLLDKYLSLVFKGIRAVSTSYSSEIGLEAECELRRLIQSVLSKESKQSEHNFYQTVFDYINSHPSELEDRYAIAEYYFISLADEFFEYKIKDFASKIKDKIRSEIDIIDLDRLYNEICSYLYSKRLMEELNFVIVQRFIYAYPIQIVSQGLAIGFLNCLLHIDEESGKQLFRLMLE